MAQWISTRQWKEDSQVHKSARGLQMRRSAEDSRSCTATSSKKFDTTKVVHDSSLPTRLWTTYEGTAILDQALQF